MLQGTNTLSQSVPRRNDTEGVPKICNAPDFISIRC